MHQHTTRLLSVLSLLSQQQLRLQGHTTITRRSFCSFSVQTTITTTVSTSSSTSVGCPLSITIIKRFFTSNPSGSSSSSSPSPSSPLPSFPPPPPPQLPLSGIRRTFRNQLQKEKRRQLKFSYSSKEAYLNSQLYLENQKRMELRRFKRNNNNNNNNNNDDDNDNDNDNDNNNDDNDNNDNNNVDVNQRLQQLPRVLLDMGMTECLTHKEKLTTANQILYLYSEQRKSARPLQLSLIGLSPNFKEQYLIKLGIEKWKISILEQDLTDFGDKSDFVYLTSDSLHTLDSIEQHKTYIIGGLAEHNRLKFMTLKRALSLNIATARFPTKEYLGNIIGHSFTLNSVYKILLDQAQNDDWETNFRANIPPRLLKLQNYFEKNDEIIRRLNRLPI